MNELTLGIITSLTLGYILTWLTLNLFSFCERYYNFQKERLYLLKNDLLDKYPMNPFPNNGPLSRDYEDFYEDYEYPYHHYDLQWFDGESWKPVRGKVDYCDEMNVRHEDSKPMNDFYWLSEDQVREIYQFLDSNDK